MLLIDTHAHLDYFKDVGAIIENAKKAGVKAIIANGLNAKSNRATLALSKKYTIIKPALGIYPVDALKLTEEEIDKEIEFISKQKITAIGEVGLDYHWVKDKNEEQKIIFQKFIKLAEKMKKPLIVHSRKAEADTIEILESAKVKVVMHCFGGNLKLAKKVQENGWFFSIPTSIVYDNHFQKIVEQMPMSQILTETDSPYLSPFKGKTNEPANIIEAVKKIAEIQKLDVKETANIIYMNYQNLF
jgi:TatD DNase family protein